MNIRHITIATAIVAAIGLSACSSETKRAIDSGSTIATVIGDATTVPGATVAPVTVVPATAPVATVAPATAPPATTPAATTPAATTPPAPGLSLYDEVLAPRPPTTHSDPFAFSGTLANGVYWVIYQGGETMTPSIEVVQAFFGGECETQAVASGEECLNDIFVLGTPSREFENLAFTNDVYLTVASSDTQRQYWITPDELRSVRASSASDPAPADFSFSSFPFLMTVQGGQITKFEQVWVP